MITFRKIEEKDRDFIEKVYRSTREDELKLLSWTELQKQSFIIMQSIAQETEYKNKFPGATFEIILHNQKPAGRLYLYESDTHLKVIDITLLPPFQGKAIGTSILKDLAVKAKQRKKIFSLSVRRDNRAIHLYHKLGFKKISSLGDYDNMELHPIL